MQEKLEWLESIKASKILGKYVYSFHGSNHKEHFVLSEDYIKNTSLKELKAEYEENKARTEKSVKRRKSIKEAAEIICASLISAVTSVITILWLNGMM